MISILREFWYDEWTDARALSLWIVCKTVYIVPTSTETFSVIIAGSLHTKLEIRFLVPACSLRRNISYSRLGTNDDGPTCDDAFSVATAKLMNMIHCLIERPYNFNCQCLFSVLLLWVVGLLNANEICCPGASIEFDVVCPQLLLQISNPSNQTFTHCFQVEFPNAECSQPAWKCLKKADNTCFGTELQSTRFTTRALQTAT